MAIGSNNSFGADDKTVFYSWFKIWEEYEQFQIGTWINSFKLLAFKNYCKGLKGFTSVQSVVLVELVFVLVAFKCIGFVKSDLRIAIVESVLIADIILAADAAFKWEKS